MNKNVKIGMIQMRVKFHNPVHNLQNAAAERNVPFLHPPLCLVVLHVCAVCTSPRVHAL